MSDSMIKKRRKVWPFILLIPIAFIILLFAIFLISTGFSSEPVGEKTTNIPDVFWNAPLLMRPGVSDFKGATVGQIFKGVKFKEVKNADGTVNTFKIVPVRMNGDVVIVEWYPIMSDKPDKDKTVRFLFKYDGKTALLYEVYSEEKDTGFKDFNSIAFMIGVYGTTIEGNLF